MWIIALVLLGAILHYLLQASTKSGSDGSQGENPLDILKKRCAGGELDKEEFERMKKELES